MNANEHECSDNLIFKDEVFRIIGSAMNVSNTLGAGFLEAVYQEALEIELTENLIPFDSQKELKIKYKDKILKKSYIVDLICFEKIIIEIKAIKSITSIEEAQILNYLKATGLPVGIIINFGSPKLEWKRYINTRH